jgi:endonuclease/exonuclease/phosphatase family metal-dependent hydrolase
MHLPKSVWPAVIVMLQLCTPAAQADPLRVMTFNIRYGTAPDGDNAWPHRREIVADVIRDYAPDVLGLQEALQSQLDELRERLPEYAMVGVGRDADGGGEYSALMYRPERLDVSDAGTFWLSATPATPGSRTWGNNLPRICTWARFLDRTSARRFLVFNTHWDHESQPARLEGAKLLGERVSELSMGGEPAIVMGDFNATPDNPAFQALLETGGLKDTFRAVHPDESDVGTFNGFRTTWSSRKIDAVVVSEEWQVEDAAIVRTQVDNRFPSDHFPVTATVTLPESGAGK